MTRHYLPESERERCGALYELIEDYAEQGIMLPRSEER